jgi:hypothetical protein
LTNTQNLDDVEFVPAQECKNKHRKMEEKAREDGGHYLSTILSGLVVLCLFLLLKKRRKQASVGLPPQVEIGIPYLGPAIAFGTDPVSTLQILREQHGNCFSLNLLLFNATFLMEPTMFKHFFNAKEEDLNFMKGVEKFMKPIFGIPKED